MDADTKRQTRGGTARRRREIARAARDLIAEKGFEGLRTRDIADRVGINVATLHYHVPTKESLVELVTESLRDEFVSQHQRGLREDASPLEMLRKEFADFRETLTDNPVLFRVMAGLSERARRDPKVAAILRPMQAGWAKQIAAVLAAGRDDGTFRADIDALCAATMVIGAMVTASTHGDIRFFDRVAAELERAIINPNSA